MDILKQYTPNRVAEIDADSILYIVYYRLTKKRYGVEEYSNILNHILTKDMVMSSINELIQYDNIVVLKKSSITNAIDDFIRGILRASITDSSRLFITRGKNNFRYKLYPDYKGTRSNSERPIQAYMDTALNHIRKTYETIECHDYEADDGCIYEAKITNGLVCSIDKDVIGQVEQCFNYSKMTLITNTPSDVLRFPYLQCLTGDRGDNIIGLKGVGTKTAIKLLNHIGDEPMKLWREVEAIYVAKSGLPKGEAKALALMNMRLVHMHQLTDKGIVLWRP